VRASLRRLGRRRLRTSGLPLWAIGRGVANPGILFVGSQIGAIASRLLAGRLADRYGRRTVLAPAMVGVAATLGGMSAAVGLPAFFILAVGYGALYGAAAYLAQLRRPRAAG